MKRLWLSTLAFCLRHGKVFAALPLCSSVCFFGLRFVLAAIGVSV